MNNPPLILIVDDEENFLEIFSTKLKASGFSIATARSAREGFQRAQETKPDLVLMDIHMPDVTGTDAALAIKQAPELKDTRVVFLTSLKYPWPGLAGDNAEISKTLGMQDFLQKTDDLDSLVGKIKAILGIEQSAAQVPPTAAPA